MSATVNKLTYGMVTLVRFLLTILTEFRQLKTNLQALCCLTARTKKGRTAIRVAPEVLSRGLLQAPAELRTEAPAGATRASSRDEHAALAVERVHSQSSTDSIRRITPQKCLKGVHCTEVRPKLPKQRSTQHHTTVPVMYRIQMQRLLPISTQKILKEK